MKPVTTDVDALSVFRILHDLIKMKGELCLYVGMALQFGKMKKN